MRWLMAFDSWVRANSPVLVATYVIVAVLMAGAFSGLLLLTGEPPKDSPAPTPIEPPEVRGPRALAEAGRIMEGARRQTAKKKPSDAAWAVALNDCVTARGLLDAATASGFPAPELAAEVDRCVENGQCVSGQAARAALAKGVLDAHFLDQGLDIALTVSGTCGDTLNMTWVLWSRPAIRTFEKGEMPAQLRAAGFKRVEMSTGFGDVWTLDL